jgi:O-acetyl-ADP-ribose deacetylase (regulator of RNase III)
MVQKQINNSTLILDQGDITKEKTDAIVNAANPGLMGGGGVDGAIHRAGGSAILEECKKIRAKQGLLSTGKAVITTGGNLSAKYVIHTVGPIWRGGNQGEPELLKSCYIESLKVAVTNGCKSIAFPSISTGAYGYPVEKAAPVALEAVINFLKENKSIEEVRFILFDSHTFDAYNNAFKQIFTNL